MRLARLALGVAVTGAVLMTAAPADAQIPGGRGYGTSRGRGIQSRRPTVSPYLNLLRDNQNGLMPNYYSFVRPQVVQRAVNMQTQGDIRQLQTGAQQAGAGMTPTQPQTTTGHPTTFMNFSHYFRGHIAPPPGR